MNQYLQSLIEERDLAAKEPCNARYTEYLDEQIRLFIEAGETHFEESNHEQLSNTN